MRGDEALQRLPLRALSLGRRPLLATLGGQVLAQCCPRARCSGLLTAATPVSSSSATSAAGQSSTSRSTSTARWRGGRSWITARNVSSIVSRPISAACGSSDAGAACSSSRSGYGSSHGTSRNDSSDGTRRRLALIVSRHALVAILYSHAPQVLVAPEVGASPPRAQERLLHEVLGLLEGAEHAVAVDVQLVAVTLRALGEL